MKQTSVPRSLIEIRAEVATQVETLQALSHALRDVWMSIAYRHFQASAVKLYADGTVLRFATVIANDAFFVSGTARIAGTHHQELAERYAREFGILGTLDP